MDYESERIEVAQAFREDGKRLVLQKPGVKLTGGPRPTYGPPTNYLMWGIENLIRNVAPDGRVLLTRVLSVAADPPEVIPNQGDRIIVPPGDEVVTVDGVTLTGYSYEIKVIEPLSPGDVILLWNIELTR